MMQNHSHHKNGIQEENPIIDLDNDNNDSNLEITKQPGVETFVEQRLMNRLLQAFICEKLLPYTIENDTLSIPLTRLNKTIVADSVQHFNLGKFKINGKVLLNEHDEWVRLDSLSRLLNLIHLELQDEIELDKWNTFVEEVANGLVNDLLVTKFSKEFNINLSASIKNSSCQTFLDYINTHSSLEEKLVFFESWATKGHPYHPCNKTKLGFSRHDYLNYSPEFNPDIYLPLAAVDKSLLHCESESDNLNYNHWFAMTFTQQWSDFQTKLTQLGISENDYSPIFIHPWQFENKITSLFHSLIENKQLILFKDITLLSKPSLSFRTLIVKNDPKKPHIKIPVAVHSTSALRTNSPASVENGPRLTKILKNIFIQEDQLGRHLKLAYESLGLHIKHPDPHVVKHLGIIYRDNPANLMTEKQMPIVVASLFEKSPINQLPLFIELIQLSMRDSSLASAASYFENYCRIVIRPYLHLLLEYGVALEGHQQNTIAVFENYHPVFMVARDLSGMRVHSPTLQSKGFHFDAYPNSETLTNDRADVTNKFLHTVIQYHLGEIVLLLAQHYTVSENLFWKMIRNTIDQCFAELKHKIDPERWQREYRAILEDDWQVKGLLRMRLNNLSKQYIYINHQNPLRDL